MKTASLKEIKTELNNVHPGKLLELCLHLARHKKENKEFLSYLLFDSYDEKAYISAVISEMDELFKDVKRSNLYLAKKSIRKILAVINKRIKFSGSKLTKLELLLYFCAKLRNSGMPLHLNSALGKLYWRQVQKAKVALSALHEDLQFDYSEQISQCEFKA